jgi:hypothetical protein
MAGERRSEMGAAVRVGLVAGVVGAVAAVGAVPATGGSGGGSGTSTTAQFGDEVRGTVQAVESGRGARVYVSLHGLERGARYRVVQTRAGCDEADGVVDAADYVVWRVPIQPRRGGDAFRTRRVRLRAPLEDAKSVVLFDVTDPQQPTRQGCSLIDVWEHA